MLATKHQNWMVVLTQAGNTLIDGLVLLIVFFEGEQVDNGRYDIIDWNLICVSHDHSAEAS